MAKIEMKRFADEPGRMVRLSDFERGWMSAPAMTCDRGAMVRLVDIFTAERQGLFLDHLAMGSNVGKAAQIAGIEPITAYRLKRECPVFRAAWREALWIGYEELEMQMLERARFGTVKTIARKGEQSFAQTEYDETNNNRLLASHKREVAEVKSADPELDGLTARERLQERLAALRNRMIENEAAGLAD
ncbi:MAG: hypothetical protein R3E02_06325 [Blastomonas sp.]